MVAPFECMGAMCSELGVLAVYLYNLGKASSKKLIVLSGHLIVMDDGWELGRLVIIRWHLLNTRDFVFYSKTNR